MKLFIIFVALFSFSLANSVEKIEFSKFKKAFGKVYKSLAEEQERFEIFKQNLQTVNDHNKKYDNGEVTYFLRVNQFSDWTRKEFSQYNRAKPPTNFTITPMPKVPVPDAIDWRDQNIFNEIQDQGNCGSCYAFAAVGAVEALHALYHGELVSLSTQNIIDCTNGVDGNVGCDGGHDFVSIDYMAETGINYEADYPYKQKLGNCQFDASRKADVSVAGHTFLGQTEDDLQTAVGTMGPVSVMIDIDDLQQYGGGIFDHADCLSDVNHFVVAVGYGSENGADYWINRNSYSDTWGEKGYLRLARNANNQCGFGVYNVFPNVN